MCGEPAQGSVLQCRGHTETILKGELKSDWAGILCLCARSGSANKETRVKVQFGLTESSCAGRTKNSTVRDCGTWHNAAGEGAAEWRVWP